MQHLKDAYASSVQPAADALLKAYPGLLEPHWFTWERFLWASELSYAYTMQVAFCMFGPAFGSQFQSKCESADRDKYCNDRETLRMHESHRGFKKYIACTQCKHRFRRSLCIKLYFSGDTRRTY